MSISNHLGLLTPTSDQLNAIRRLDQFLSNDSDVFILEGYAGTGKTTLLKGVVDYLNSTERKYQLMAPTGRAAKVIHQKTGYTATTVHKGIYSFEDLEEYQSTDSKNNASFRYFFKLRNNVNVFEHVFIVDEASMLSNNLSEAEFFRFGSGYLLRDLITFSRIQTNTAKTKIIFIGDSAQLPPVGMNFSPALNEEYLKNTFNLKTERIELKEVKRQDADNGILLVASKLRKCLTSGFFNEFDLRPNQKEIFNPSYSSFLEDYTNKSGQKIVITYKNKTALDLNKLIRSAKYGGDKTIQSSDIVIFGSNNYKLGILNGEFAVVTKADDFLTSRTVKFYTEKGITSTVILNWRGIELIAPDEKGADKNIRGYMLENFLTGDNYLKPEEMQALYIDFKIRHEKLKPKSIEFSEALRNDPFFNCIQLKYGYAVTCHKAQGGEWDHTFVFWDKGTDSKFDFYNGIQTKKGKLNDDFYRWAYTAITRASKTLSAINPPFFNSYSNLMFIDASIQNSYKEITNNEIKPIELELTDEFSNVLKEFQLEDSPMEIQDHFIKFYYLLRKNYIDIIGWKKVNLEIRYYFKRVNEIVAAKFWINQKNEFNKNFMILPQPNDSKELFDKVKSLIDNSVPIVINRIGIESILTKVVFEVEIEEKKPFLATLFEAITHSIETLNFIISKIDHFPYRERYHFARNTEKVVIDFEYDQQGLFGRVVPVESASNSNELVSEIKLLVDKLKTSSHVI